MRDDFYGLLPWLTPSLYGIFQVKFMTEAFSHLRPGVPVKCLHGKMKQMKRMAAFYEFCDAK